MIEARDAAFRDLIAADPVVEKLSAGIGFGEGPVWDRANARLIFSDMNHDHMRCWSAAGGIATFRKPSNRANGNTYDRQGRLVSCEHATSRVVRQEADGTLTVLASHFDGRELNSPNDIVVKSDGAIYFSDPPYGRIREDVGVLRELQLDVCGVYRLPASGGAPQLLVNDFERPNGLCFTLDEQQVYINDTARKHIRRFDVQSDGTLKGGAVWAETKGDAPGAPDGMKIDGLGNLYCTGPGGVHVFGRDARLLGIINTPERVTNLAWGEEGARSLFLTGITSLYRVRVKTPGRLAY
jgi:gluconolactonase